MANYKFNFMDLVVICALVLCYFDKLPTDFTKIIDFIGIQKVEEKYVITIKEPSEEAIKSTKNIASLIKEPKDRAELAVFFDELASRSLNYDDYYVSDVLKIYGQSFKDVFGDKYNKYPEFSKNQIILMSTVTGPKDRTLSLNDVQKLSDIFRGIAWNLTEPEKSQ